ncbi:BZIP transcription factor [Paragonimus heterotremus]|uniref:BZIP transcription factor n=1 Tax=Paragonimus heterotremus TaxID=100268 RepID=A0A8J4T837_9TREM|nr:BZIP transcription factor [Paragonimus heterotremus]
MCSSSNVIMDSYYPLCSNFPPFVGFETLITAKSCSDKASDTSGSGYCSDLSPNISVLDHQEIVETDLPNPSTKEDILSEQNTFGDVKCNTSWEATDLFSFEVETYDIPQSLIGQPCDLPSDFDWLDELGTIDGPVDLNDINLTPTCFEKKLSTRENSKDDSMLADLIFAPPSDCPLKSGNSMEQHKHELLISPHMRYPFQKTKTEDDSFSISAVTRQESFLHNEDLACGKPGERLYLSVEERKMLLSMGVRLPARFPLTRAEERALRTVRRKIRNKLSAQASRIKRQEYMSNLERCMEVSNKENEKLRRQIAKLEGDKRDLISHVRRLRSYVARLLNREDRRTPLPLFVRSKTDPKFSKTASQAAAGGTSLLIVTFMILAWTALVPVPSGNSTKTDITRANGVFSFFPGRSRTLLESKSIEATAFEDLTRVEQSRRSGALEQKMDPSGSSEDPNGEQSDTFLNLSSGSGNQSKFERVMVKEDLRNSVPSDDDFPRNDPLYATHITLAATLEL